MHYYVLCHAYIKSNDGFSSSYIDSSQARLEGNILNTCCKIISNFFLTKQYLFKTDSTQQIYYKSNSATLEKIFINSVLSPLTTSIAPHSFQYCLDYHYAKIEHSNTFCLATTQMHFSRSIVLFSFFQFFFFSLKGGQ